MTPKTRHEYLPNFLIDSSLLSLISRFPHERCRDRFRSKTNKRQPPSTASSKGGLSQLHRRVRKSHQNVPCQGCPEWPFSLAIRRLFPSDSLPKCRPKSSRRTPNGERRRTVNGER